MYVLDSADYPQPWKIQSTYPVGATLYKGEGLEKQWISRHYRQILTETQRAEALAEYQKKREQKERYCVICGALIGGNNKKTCSPECRKKLRAQRKCEHAEKERLKRRTMWEEHGKACAICGEQFMPDRPWRRNCPKCREIQKQKKLAYLREYVASLREHGKAKKTEKENKND